MAVAALGNEAAADLQTSAQWADLVEHVANNL
jgi:hypothetical protein